MRARSDTADIALMPVCPDNTGAAESNGRKTNSKETRNVALIGSNMSESISALNL
jgi:hypothetical protein